MAHQVAQTPREFVVFLRYLRSLYPAWVRLGILLDNFSPHLSTSDDPLVGQWAVVNNVELAYTTDKRNRLGSLAASSRRKPATSSLTPAHRAG
jgi:hypothetical protein